MAGSGFDRKVSRRGLLTGWLTSAKEAARAEEEQSARESEAARREAARLAPRAQQVAHDVLPLPATIRADHETMVGFGPRLPGSSAHGDFVSWMRHEMSEAGCYERSTTEHAETLWLPRRWALDIAGGPEAGEVPVATFRARSGVRPDGSTNGTVRAPLVLLGRAPALDLSAGDVAAARREHARQYQEWFAARVAALGSAAEGAILVVDLGGPPVLNQGQVGGMTGCYYTQAPNHLTWPLWNQSRPWRKLWMLPEAAAAAGAVRPAGLLYLVDASHDELSDQFLPPSGAPTEVPALMLDREAGARVRRAAEQPGTIAELTLDATTSRTRTPSVVFKLPGTEEDRLCGGKPDLDDAAAGEVEYVVLSAPSDGVSVAHGNGSLALAGIARYFAALKQQGRGLRRTLVFSAVTGTMAARPAARGFLDEHPRIVKGAAFAMTVDGLGCAEWIQDGDGYHRTGFPEPALLIHDQGLTPLVYDAYIARSLLNHGVSTGAAASPGFGRDLAEVLPTVSFVAAPTYLHQAGPGFGTGGRLEQLDEVLFAHQLEMLIDVVAGFDALPKDPAGASARGG